MEIINIIPIIDNENIEINNFNKNEFLIEHKIYKHQININEQAYNLIKLIDNKTTIKELTAIYNEKYNSNISCDFIYDILHNKLTRYGIIIKNNFTVKKRGRANYLKLSLIFLKKEYSTKIINSLKFLFNRSIVFFILILSLSIVFYVIFSNYNFIKTNYRNINILNIFSLFFLSKISGIWHELGHATACRKFNIEHGDIGFGFYLLMPVFFADVSNIWKLEPKKRIVVNLGGVYFDLMFATILLIIFLFSKNINLLLFPSLILIGILYNLNPFVRYDGYWILSDLLFIPSLQKKSYALLKTFFSNLLKFKIKKQTTKNCLLILYACISLNYILFILIAIFIFNTKSVLYLPVNLHNYINRLINGNDFVFNEFFEYTIPLIFYILILKFIIEIVKKKP